MPSDSDIRQFILDFFDRKELDALCNDHFPAVYKDYAGTDVKNSAIAYALVEYCKKQGLTDTLLATLQRQRPLPFEERLGSASQSAMTRSAPIEQTQRNRTWRTIAVIAAAALLLAAVIYIAFIAPTRAPSAAPTQPATVVAERPIEAAPSSAITPAPALPVLAAISDASETCPGRLESGPDPTTIMRRRLIVAAGSVAYLHGDDVSLEGRDPLTSTLVSIYGPYDGAVAVRNGVLCAPLSADSPLAAETYAELQAECDGCTTTEIHPMEGKP